MTTPDSARVTMEFGRHSGRSLGWIAANEPSYLRWLVNNLDGEREDDEELLDAVRAVLAWQRKRGQAA